MFLIDYGLACLAGDDSGSTEDKAASSASPPTVWVEISKQDQAAAAAIAAKATRAPPAADASVGAAPIVSGGDGTEEIKAATAAGIERPGGKSPAASSSTSNDKRAERASMESNQSLESAEASQSAAASGAPFGPKSNVVSRGGTPMVETGEGGGGGGEVGGCVNDVGDGNSAQLPAQQTEAPKPTNGPTGLVGSVRYLSVAAHEGGRQTRRCDLESLAYVLIYLVRVSGESLDAPAMFCGHASVRGGGMVGWREGSLRCLPTFVIVMHVNLLGAIKLRVLGYSSGFAACLCLCLCLCIARWSPRFFVSPGLMLAVPLAVLLTTPPLQGKLPWQGLTARTREAHMEKIRTSKMEQVIDVRARQCATVAQCRCFIRCH